jgi:uncharacterized protein YjbJ (UPF0337 family)
MGVGDKAEHKVDELKGKGKEALGDATDDDQMRTEGQVDQTKGNLGQAADKVKDAFKK